MQVLREPWRDTCTLKSWNFCKRNRLYICFLFVYSTRRSPERSFLCFLAHQPCRSRLSQLRKEKDLTLTSLLVNVSLGSAEKLKTSVDYARSLTCQSFSRGRFVLFCDALGWLVGCFGFNGPLRQYFSLYRAVSQREGEREEKR